jgi:hypothetical protein
MFYYPLSVNLNVSQVDTIIHFWHILTKRMGTLVPAGAWGASSFSISVLQVFIYLHILTTAKHMAVLSVCSPCLNNEVVS